MWGIDVVEGKDCPPQLGIQQYDNLGSKGWIVALHAVANLPYKLEDKYHGMHQFLDLVLIL